MIFEAPGIGVLYNVAKDAYRKFRGQTSEEKIALREKWKPIFEDKIRDNFARELRSDVIIRDVRRDDQYPNIGKRTKGISPWFRAGLTGSYHRGLIIGLRYQKLVGLGCDKYRVLDFDKDGDDVKQDAITVILAGLVPFENILSVDMDGDEYYSYPHIYCHFSHGGEPYEETGFFTEGQLFPDSVPYHTKIADFESVRAESKRFGTASMFM